MEQNRFIQTSKKNVLRRDILRILVAVIRSFSVKKVPFIFKISLPIYLHVIKTYVRYFLSNFYFSLNDSSSKTVKNVFYFIQKALFVLEIFKFLYFFLPVFFPCQPDKIIFKEGSSAKMT